MPLASGFSPAGRLLYTEISSSLILRGIFLFCSEALWIWMLEWDLGSQGTFQVLFLCFNALWNGISDTFSKFVQVNLSLYAILELQTVDIREVPKRWFFLLLLKPWQLWWLCSAYLLAQHTLMLCLRYRCLGMECRPALFWKSRQDDPSERHTHPTPPVWAAAPGPQAGGLWAQMVYRPPAPGLWRKW